MFQMYVEEKIKTLILFSVSPPPENRVVYEVMCKNIVKPDTPPVTIYHAIRRKRNEIASRITKAPLPFTQL
jgi:hypothetical protein